jgi:hypothetical protein
MKFMRWWVLYGMAMLLAAAACVSPATLIRTSPVQIPLLDSGIPDTLETAAFALG